MVHQKTESTRTIILFNQMPWAGHIVRMEESRICKQIFYGEVKREKRPQRKHRKRFNDNVKYDRNVLHMDVQRWEELTFKSYGVATLYFGEMQRFPG